MKKEGVANRQAMASGEPGLMPKGLAQGRRIVVDAYLNQAIIRGRANGEQGTWPENELLTKEGIALTRGRYRHRTRKGLSVHDARKQDPEAYKKGDVEMLNRLQTRSAFRCITAMSTKGRRACRDAVEKRVKERTGQLEPRTRSLKHSPTPFHTICGQPLRSIRRFFQDHDGRVFKQNSTPEGKRILNDHPLKHAEDGGLYGLARPLARTRDEMKRAASI